MHNKSSEHLCSLPERLCKDLNSGQKEAVLHRDGPMLVSAGPGSGKTHVITARLVHMLLKLNIPPEKILVITFTKEAARSMSSRFHTLISESSVTFGTFHSFYYQIIRSIPLYSRYRLIFEKEKKYILSQVVTCNMTEEHIDKLSTAISYYKNTLNLSDTMEHTGVEKEEFQDILIKYDEMKNMRKCLDFDDMLYLCFKLLKEDKDLLKKWQDRFAYYLVDEFQDCNPVQYQILKLLSQKSENLFAVGDDDQAIYGFRGAQSMIMQKFLDDFPEAKRVTLVINYRCAAPIVKASEKVIRENVMRLEKEIKANRSNAAEGEKAECRKWASKSEMHHYLTEIFKKLSKEELPNHAVLFRTNQETQMFAIEMMKENVPFQIKDKNLSIYEHFIVKDMMAFLKAANGNRERKLFLRILNKPRLHIGREALEEEIVDFAKMKAFYSNKYMNHPEALQDIERLENNLEHLKKLPLFLGIRYIRMAMNYEKYLMLRADGNMALYHSWQELLDWLQEDAASFSNFREWEEYQKLYGQKLQSKEEKILKMQSGNTKNLSGMERSGETFAENTSETAMGIHLMTMHAAKGLEFDHCYILNVNEGIIPKYQKGQKLTAKQLEEERRIFYVGMTRAKKTLELHYLTGTKERPKFPSRFIHKLI